MAQNFNYKTFTGRTQVDNSQDIATVLSPNGTNNVFLYGNRRNLLTAEKNTGLPLPIPALGYPLYSYYQTYLLPSNLTTNPNGLADWFDKCGYLVNYGLSDKANINTIIALTTSPDGNTAQLYFQNQQFNTQALANRNVSGTAVIDTSTALTTSYVSVQNGSYNQVAKGTFTGSLNAIATTDTSATFVITTAQATNFIQFIDSLVSTLTFTVATATPVTFTNVPITSIKAGSGLIAYTVKVTIPLQTTAIPAQSPQSGTFSGVTVTCDTILTLNATGTLPFANVKLGNNVALSYVIATGDIDPNNTEPFVYNLWVSAKCLLSSTSLNTNATVTPPNVYFAILPDFASTNYFGPTTDSTKNPFAVGGLFNVQQDTVNKTALISISTSNPYVSFIPNVTLGNSTLSQVAVSPVTVNPTGLIQSWVLNGTNIDITLINVVGTFLYNTTPATNTNLTLDTTATILSLKNAYFAGKLLSQRGIPCIYEVVTDLDLVTYQAVFNDVLALNEPVLANVNQGNCSIVFGAINKETRLNPQQALVTLVSGDNINNQFYEPVYQYYVQRAGIRPVTTASVLCAVTCILATNTYPFNPLNDILLDGITSSPLAQDWIDLTPGGVGDSLIGLGYNILFTNSSGQTYLNLGRTGLTVVDNVPDNEFYPTYIVDVKDYNRKAVYIITKQNGVGQVRQNDSTLLAVRNAINNLLDQQAKDNIIPLSIVASLKQKVIVRRSTQNPLGLYIYYPLVQNPAFLNAYVEINNYSVNAVF